MFLKIITKNYQIFILFLFFVFLSNCGLYKKVDSSVPIQGEERARKNIEEGKGVNIKSMIGGGKTNYEFSSSNPMWRASLEILDFLPLTTVDYSGGILITDWYNNSDKQNEAIKITVRFLNNEIASNNIKIVVHKKVCETAIKCQVSESNSIIKEELKKSILKKAALLESQSKKK